MPERCRRSDSIRHRGEVMTVLVRCVAVMAAALHSSRIDPPARADDYPNRPVTMIVPWAPAGAVDTVARIVAPKLSERLGKPVVIENRGGAGSTLGTAISAKAAPDGYTLGMPGSGSMAVGPRCTSNCPTIPTKDFAPMALIGRVPFVLVVNAALPVKTVPELIAYAKANKIFYGSGGPGSPHHLYAELFKGMTGIEMTHVPYKGSADAIKDVVAGHVQLMFSDSVPSLPLIAVRHGPCDRRHDPGALVDRAGHSAAQRGGRAGLRCRGMVHDVGPAGTPQPIVERLHNELKAIMGSADVQQAVNRTGVVPVVSPPLAELPKFIVTEKERWGKVVAQAGLAGTQ